MEPLEPTSAKFKLWRWLLLLSVITIALGGFVWWKSRSERLQFVEPIWSDSLAGPEQSSVATGERRKIGEVWSLTRRTGIRWFSRGLSREVDFQYPVFATANPFHQAVSKELLAEQRQLANAMTALNWSEWWETARRPSAHETYAVTSTYQVLLVADRAITLHETRGHTSSDGGRLDSLLYVVRVGGSHYRNYVEREGRPYELHLADLFDGSEWAQALFDLCLDDLRRQGATWGEHGEKSPTADDFSVKGFEQHQFAVYAFSPAGITFHFMPYRAKLEVFIPYEKLAAHLKPDGPHRLFQTKAGE